MSPKYYQIRQNMVQKGQFANEMVLTELELLKRQRCRACSGFGHRHEDCPTHSKLTRLSEGGTYNESLIAYTRTAVEEFFGPATDIAYYRSNIRVQKPTDGSKK